MRRRFRGFSLVEVVVGVTIIALMAVAMGVLLERLPVGAREARDQDIAIKIARTEIEQLRAGGYDALPVSGPFTNSLLSSLASSSASVTVSTYSSKTKSVVATVSWRGANGVSRSLTLTTLITQNSGLP